MKKFILPKFEKITENRLSEYMESSIEAFCELSGIPVTYYDSRGELVRSFHAESRICNGFDVFSNPDEICRQRIMASADFAAKIGEPYIYLCPAGLTNIAVSLIVNGENRGCIIAGPILMGEIRESTLRKIRSINNMPEDEELQETLSAGPKYGPLEINNLAIMLYNTVLAGVGDYREYRKLRSAFDEETSLYYGMHQIGESQPDRNPIRQLEEELRRYIYSGNTTEARRMFNNAFKKMSAGEMGDLSVVKTRMIAFFTILMYREYPAAEDMDQIRESLSQDLSALNDAESLGELKDRGNALINRIIGSVSSMSYEGNSRIVARAVNYINSHFRERITLKTLEEELHVNATYISSLFKSEMGESFVSYLNSLRLKYACHLLENADMTILEIAIASGFESQSYFAKVFRSAMGTTPKKYREVLK